MEQPLQKRSSSLTQSSFIRRRTTRLVDDYKIVKQLGSGGFGQVFLLEDKETGWERCGKLIRRDSLSAFESEDIMNEIETLSKMDHPNIVKIICYYLTEEHIFIVSEYLDGGELFDRIVKNKRFSEVNAAPFMAQILSALAYLHKNKIVHRDVKPENIVFETQEEDAVLKLIDFGNSRKVTENEKLKSRLGTLYYLAPEVLEQSYDVKCDIWSAGVVLFIMIYGSPPFSGKNSQEVLQKIRKGYVTYPTRDYAVSNEVRALLSLMLNRNPENRPPAEALLQHVWFDRVRERKIGPQTEGLALIHLQHFITQSEFQKAVLIYYLTQFDLRKQKKKMLEVFRAMDEDLDGQIDKNELLRAYRRYTNDPRVEPVIQHILDQLDLNESGSIDFTEFLLATTDYRSELTVQALQQIFDSIDCDKNKFITARELAIFLNMEEGQGSSEAKKIFSEIDTNKDGMVSFEEFLVCMDKFFQTIGKD